MATLDVNITNPARAADRRMMRRAWFAMVGAAILVLAPVASINYFVDNHSLLHANLDSDGLQEYVTAMRGAKIAVRYSYNDRSVKLLVAQESTADCIAIGSSHIMTLREDRNAFIARNCTILDNAGVTGASFEDVITLMGIAVAKPNIKHLFIGVDLWTFTRNSRLNWKRNGAEMFAARALFGLSPAPYQHTLEMESASVIEQLFSFKYLMTNLRFLKRAALGKTTLTYDPRELQADDLKKELALLPDASLSYPEEFRSTPRNEDLATTDRWIAPPFIDQGVLEEFKTAIRKIVASGKSVTLIEGPYHPYVVNDCPKPRICEGIKVVDPAVRAMAREIGVPVLGSYDPAPLGLVSDDFIDFQHIRGAIGWPKVIDLGL